MRTVNVILFVHLMIIIMNDRVPWCACQALILSNSNNTKWDQWQKTTLCCDQWRISFHLCAPSPPNPLARDQGHPGAFWRKEKKLSPVRQDVNKEGRHDMDGCWEEPVGDIALTRKRGGATVSRINPGCLQCTMWNWYLCLQKLSALCILKPTDIFFQRLSALWKQLMSYFKPTFLSRWLIKKTLPFGATCIVQPDGRPAINNAN